MEIMSNIQRIYAFIFASCFMSSAHAQKPEGLPGNYPAKTVRIIIASNPGGALDISGRIVGQKLTERWGTNFVAENRAGTGIAYDLVSKAAPDGYTLMVSSTSIMYTSYGVLKPSYDVRTKFPPIAQFIAAPFIVAVTPSLPVNSMKELIAYAKANPNVINYSYSGIGSAAQLAGELLKLIAKVDIVGIPHSGVGPGYIEQMAGRIHMTIGTAASAMPLVRAGKIRAIAVTTTKRAKALPDLPAITETLPSFDNIDVWVGLLGVEGMAQSMIAALNKEVNTILQLPEVTKVLTADGSETTPTTPEQFRKVIAQVLESTDRIVRDAGIQLK